MKNLSRNLLFLALVFSAFGLITKALGLNQAETITIAELKDHVFFLASEEMGGRVIYTDAYKVAAKYCASQYRRAGLTPINKTGDCETYFFEVPFVKKTPRAESPMIITNGSSTYAFDATAETRYLFVKDVSVFREETPVVFAGYGISAPEHGWDDFEGLDLDGKIIVVLAGVPIRDGQPVLPSSIHKLFDSSNPVLRYYQKYLSVAKHSSEPAAIVIVSDDIINKRWDGLGGKYEGFKVFLAEDANEPEGEHNVMLISREIAKALFEDQAYNPLASTDVDLDEYRTYELDNVVINLEVGFELEEFPSWNVIGIVSGNDPVMKDEYILVGGHLDHVPPSRGQVMNGADDNASGCAGVLEVAEAMAISQPKRSVVFCLWTGEEPLRGDNCMGSKFFLENSPLPVEKMKAYINLDMIGRTQPDNEHNRAHIIGSTEEMLPAVDALVRPINEQKVKWPIVYEVMAASDHMSFLAAGIPAFVFFSGDHGDSHTPRDDPERIDYEKMEKLSRLAFWISLELANGKKTLEFSR